MDYYQVANHFLWLYSLSVSFAILVMVINFPYQQQRQRILGAAFTVPFTGYLMSGLLIIPGLQIDQVYWMAETLLLLMVMLIYWGIVKEKTNLLYFLMTGTIISVVVFWMTHRFAMEIISKVDHRFALWFLWIPAIMTAYKMKQNKEGFNRYHYGFLMIVMAYTAQFFQGSLYVPEVSLLLKIAGYTLFLIHFSRSMEKEIKEMQHLSETYQRRFKKTADHAAKNPENEIVRSHQTILENAKKDGLTGAFNRISIMDFIDEQIRQNDGSTFTVLMFDIDKFKEVNDRFGHVKGDIALKTLSSVTQNVIRDHDLLGRYGEDEFIILLPKLNLAEGKLVAERLLGKIQNTKDPHFTISVGISVYPEDGESVTELIQKADRGLYRSKEKGGNSISHHEVF